eukprot:3096259-Lingulodinium_polyedra.AAC.1
MCIRDRSPAVPRSPVLGTPPGMIGAPPTACTRLRAGLGPSPARACRRHPPSCSLKMSLGTAFSSGRSSAGMPCRSCW